MIKRIGAIIFILFFLSLYIVGLVAAILQKDYAANLLVITTMLATILPIFIFMIHRFFLLRTNTLVEIQEEENK
ncbi:hypothetical protein EDC18_106177 [Natranaerovirga pectinivora]|uniref:Uncharacterized protein n=1 Tax=Natranaerovirga pectinivora TaxID=682400 RepID=A0A4R3MKY4_9FIRM|nr:hypothetical protein [Natranaerovirga pectinivora]TCT14373.1 hypothetical protein EDC18_106177 [Natranaerovirga pectinivora]